MIKQGSKVKAHYTGRLNDDDVFDTSMQDGRDPLEFTIGEGALLPAFENELLGLATGDKKTFELTSDDAYGPYRDDLRLTVPRTNVPQGVEVGQSLQGNFNNEMITFMVRQVNEDNVIVDANHPLAGKALIFDVEIVEID
jgi:FKBP-type peptidyl-prolyl cis-trans isomerase 2